MNPFTRQRETPASVALVSIGAGSIDPVWSTGFDAPCGLGVLGAPANRFATLDSFGASSPATGLLECAWGDDDDEDDDFDFLDDDDDELDEDEDDDAEEEEAAEEEEELEEGEEAEEAEEAEEDEDLLEDDEEEEAADAPAEE